MRINASLIFFLAKCVLALSAIAFSLFKENICLSGGVQCTDWQFLLVGLNMMLINISWCVGGAGGAGVCISLAGPEPSLNTVRPYSLHSTHFSSQPALSVFSTVEQTGLSDTVSDQTEITVLTRNRVTSRKCPDLTSRGVE